jgi:DNA-binding Lrp family transcriptional regulator
MDRIDRKLLAALQADSQASLAQLADRVGLSSSACHRRMRALEETGTITGYGARVDPARVGLNLHALIDITLESQSRGRWSGSRKPRWPRPTSSNAR